MQDQDPLVQFYSGVGTDDRGRSVHEIQRWTDEQLEEVHDYIQWLFPLEESSGFNPDAPTASAGTIKAFRNRPELRTNLRVSLRRMLAFYGFELVDKDPLRVVPSPAFADRSRTWLTYGNHNHLRITRILTSLRLLGLEEESAAFFRCLAGLYGRESASSNPRISEESFQFWKSAAGAQSDDA